MSTNCVRGTARRMPVPISHRLGYAAVLGGASGPVQAAVVFGSNTVIMNSPATIDLGSLSFLPSIDLGGFAYRHFPVTQTVSFSFSDSSSLPFFQG